MVCLDSDILVSFLRRQPQALAMMARLESESGRLSTTIVTVCELFEGAAAASDPSRARSILESLLARMDLLDLDLDSANRFGQIRFSLRRQGLLLEDMDLMIASIALAHGQPLVTRNRKHFERVPGLKIQSW